MVSDKKDNVFRMRVAEITVEVHSLYTDVKEMCREYLCEDKPDVVIVMTEEDIGNERKRYPDGEKMAAGYIETLAVYRKLAEAALDHEILLIHGSAVAVDGKGYLFLAPSGTGKSTHTRLWREYFGDRAEMINDINHCFVWKRIRFSCVEHHGMESTGLGGTRMSLFRGFAF